MVLRASGSPEPVPAEGDSGNYDLDNLLAGYRTARAQEALFDVRGGAGTGYDEFVDAAGNIRPAWQELAECVGERGRGGLDRLRAVVRGLVDNDGITYIEVDRHGDEVTNGDGTAVPGQWHLDALPLLISPSDWDTLESGLVQRSRLLDAVLTDLYGPRRSVTGGVLPAQLLFAHPGYVRAARGIEVPGRHQLFLHGCDISRSGSGTFLVNADWTQAPSGAGYALADRRVVAHAIPDLYERIGAAARLAVGAGAAAGADRRRPRSGRGTRGGGAQPGHPLRDRVRPGVSGVGAGFPAGGKRRPGGARRQAVDAVDGHAETRRRGVAPGGRRLRRPAGPARRLAARRGRARRGAAPRRGDRGQHAGQRHPGKPWAASLSARAGRAVTG